MRAALLCLCFLASGRITLAQTQLPDPWEQGRVRIGPVAFTPGLTLKNLGWDSNVFNEAEDPKSDFTVTAGGLVNWWMRVGNLRLIGISSVDGVYYATYTSERGVNHHHDFRVEYRLNRLRPYAHGSYASVKDRVGYEVDTRSRHTETAIGAGVVVRVAAKTSVDVAARQTTTTFPEDEVYDGTVLAQSLNRKDGFSDATLRYAVTSLTALTLLGEYRQERYDQSPVRDNDSFLIMPGVQFDPFALLNGSARVGYRHFHPLSPTIPSFDGVVAAVSLNYVLLGRTRFSVGVDRDIQASYDNSLPYYVLTGVGGAVRQGLGKGWDVEVRGANQRLAYPSGLDASGNTIDRVDRVVLFGGGVGYRLGQGTRIGANVDYSRRPPGYRPGFETLRFGISAAYEF